MRVLISVLIGILFTTIIYLGVIYRIKKNKKIDLLDFFLLSIGAFNGIGFGFVMWSTYEGRNHMQLGYLMTGYDIYTIINYIFMNIIICIAVFWGWYISNSNIKKIKYKVNEIPSIKLKEDKNVLNGFLLVAWIMLFISIVSYWVYTKSYGGFVGIIDYKKAIRAGVTNINNPYSFLKRFGSFAFFSSFIFYGIIISKENKIHKLKYNLIGLIISVCFSLYVLYTWDGRVSIVVYVITFILSHALYNYRTILKLFKKLIVIIICGTTLILGSDILIGSTSNKLGIVELLSEELTFPFISFISQIQGGMGRCFKDIMISPLYILPEKIWGGIFGLDTASTFNTIILMGSRKGERGITGEIPIDLLTFGNIQAPVIGIVIVGILFGYILNRIEKHIKKIPVKGIKICIYSNIALYVAILSVLYGDPEHIITRNFHNICGILFIWIMLNIKSKSIILK